MTLVVGPKPKDKCPCRRQRQTLREGVGKPEAETDGDTVLRDKEVGRPLPEIFQKSDPADVLILNSQLLELAIMFSVVPRGNLSDCLLGNLGTWERSELLALFTDCSSPSRMLHKSNDSCDLGHPV